MVYRWLAPNVTLPLHDRLAGRRLWAEVGRLRELEWADPAELEARALARLRRLVGHARRRVPHYRDLLGPDFDPAELRTTEDLVRLPILTRRALRDGFPDRLLADGVPAGRRVRLTTSGSSGFPLELYGDLAAEDVWLATHFLFLGWFGTGPWDTRVTLTSARYLSTNVRTPGWPARLLRRLLLGEQVVHLAGLELTAEALRDRLARVGRPYYLRGYPTYLAELASGLLERGLELATYPVVVATHAETLTPFHADLIGRAFRCPVANQYSTWEIPQIAQSCPERPELLHVNSQRALVHIRRPDGSAAPPGEPGRVVVTDLENEVMPLINYELSDQAAAGPPCPCGRGFPTIERLEGRPGPPIRTADGRLLSVGALAYLLTWEFPVGGRVREFQLVQRSATAACLRLVPTARFDAAFADELRARLAAWLGPTMRVELEPVERIAPEPSGKRLFIKSEPGG